MDLSKNKISKIPQYLVFMFSLSSLNLNFQIIDLNFKFQVFTIQFKYHLNYAAKIIINDLLIFAFHLPLIKCLLKAL